VAAKTLAEAIALRPNYMNSLLLLQQRGFAPSTILDVGAAEGAFFVDCRQNGLFPQAQHFFVDAMAENEALYRKATEKFGGGYEIAALSVLEGETDLRIDPEFYNTHIDGVQDGTTYQAVRRVPVRTLDGVVRRHALRGPFLLKLDVQGSEVDVLRGGVRVLEEAIMVATEVQIYSVRDTLVDLLGFMQAQGWALFDLTDLSYQTTTDFSLYQCYATFIPKAMDFRKGTEWCAPDALPAVLAGLRERRERYVREMEALLG
jgi:FkbM family methyltransferase